jgi:hypothetical protein
VPRAAARSPSISRSSRARASSASSIGASLPPVTAPIGSIAFARQGDHRHGMRGLAPEDQRGVEVVGDEHVAEHRLRQRPVRRIDLELVDEPAARRHDDRRAPLGIARDRRRRAAFLGAEPANRVDRVRRARHHDLLEPYPARPRRPARVAPDTQDVRQQQRSAVARSQARGPAGAAFRTSLQLPQRIGARHELRDGVAGALDRLDRVALVARAARAPGSGRRVPRSPASARRPAAGTPSGRFALPRVQVEPRTERALLLFELQALALELVAAPLERLAEVPQPHLVSQRFHERVLADLDLALERPAGGVEVAQLALGRFEALRGLAFGDAALARSCS